jgi:hypothetical protein
MTNSQLTGNRAEGYHGEPLYPGWNKISSGGAIGVNFCQLASIGCTFDGNCAERGDTLSQTGVLQPYFLFETYPESWFLLGNCIVQNEGETSFYLSESLGTVLNCDLKGSTLTNCNIDTDPMFVRPGHWDDNDTPNDELDDIWIDGDYRLQWESPCINAGDRLDETVLDLAGKPRVLQGLVDMGALETPFPGDSDWDDDVDTLDLLSLAGQWLIQRSDETQPPLDTDLNYDDIVNLSDLTIFSESWMTVVY